VGQGEREHGHLAAVGHVAGERERDVCRSLGGDLGPTARARPRAAAGLQTAVAGGLVALLDRDEVASGEASAVGLTLAGGDPPERCEGSPPKLPICGAFLVGATLFRKFPRAGAAQGP
jgi:hypothetical protein